jgi:hypothetical protein
MSESAASISGLLIAVILDSETVSITNHFSSVHAFGPGAGTGRAARYNKETDMKTGYDTLKEILVGYAAFACALASATPMLLVTYLACVR